MTYDHTAQRLFVETSISKNSPIPATREQANYLLNVLRLKKGGNILIFNGVDGEWLAHVEPSGRKACELLPVEQTRGQSKPGDLQYIFAPLKQARLDYMVQKAVEMGASLLQPVLTHRTQVRSVNSTRMRANAIEAGEQCGILHLPEIRSPEKLETLLSSWNTDRHLIFCDECATFDDTFSKLGEIKEGKLAVLIGPEGGFSPAERELLLSQHFVSAISLGPRILRADTAAVAALAVLQAAIGDWKNKGCGQ